MYDQVHKHMKTFLLTKLSMSPVLSSDNPYWDIHFEGTIKDIVISNSLLMSENI